MRKLAIVVGVIVVLAVIVLVALPFALDVNNYRSRIQAELEKRTGRSVSLGRMNLKLFPLAFRVENAVIGEDPQFPHNVPFAQAGELLVSAKLMPLIHGDVEVDSVVLKNPKIELIRNEQGVWNFSSLGKPKQQQPAAAQPAAQPNTQAKPQQPAQPGPGQQFSLKKLDIIDGQVAVTDFRKKKPRTVYDNVDLGLSDYEPDKPVSVVLAAHLPGQGKQTIEFDGKGGPLRHEDIALTNVKGKLKLDQVSLSGLKRFLNSPALQGVEFTATGTADIDASNGNLNSDGNLKLADMRVRNVDVGYPITADYNVNANLNSEVYNIKKGSLKLGATPFSVSGVFNGAPTPAQMDLKVTAGNASISEMARLAAAFGVAFNPNMQINGRVDADLSARGATSNPKMNGTVAARELVITGKELPQEVHVTNVNVAFTPDTVRSNEFMASTGSTAVKVNFELDNYSAKNSTINAAVGAPNAQLGELLNIAKAYGVSAVEGMSGSGPVSINVRVQGPTKTPSQMVYSGNGKFQNASLQLPSLTKPVRINNADLQFTQNSAILSNAAFSIGSTNANGQITIKGLAPNASPETQFALAADKVDVAELEQLFKKQNPAPANRASDTFNLVPTAHAQMNNAPVASSAKSPSLIQRLVGNGNIQVGNILYQEIQYTNVKSGVKLDHGVIHLEPFTAQVFGGTQAGTVVLDTRPERDSYTVTSKFDHVDANKLLSAVSSAKQVLFGTLSANANTAFVTGPSGELVRSMNGTVNVDLQNGKIAHLDLLNELASIGKFMQSGKQSEPFTNVAKLTGDFKITNGLARTDNLKAVIDGGTLAANGAVNLADQTLNMQLIAVLSKDYSQTVGGTGIGGYLNTALANSKGELVMPVLVTGTFSNPHIAPDVQRLAQMKMENLLPSASNPGALTTGILNSVLGNKGANQGGTNQQQNGGIKGILGQLSGQTQQNQQQQQQNQQQNAATPNQTQPTQPNTAPNQAQTPNQDLPASDNPNAANPGTAQQNPPKPTNPLDQILGAVAEHQKKKKATPPQQAPPPPPQSPPPGN